MNKVKSQLWLAKLATMQSELKNTRMKKVMIHRKKCLSFYLSVYILPSFISSLLRLLSLSLSLYRVGFGGFTNTDLCKKTSNEKAFKRHAFLRSNKVRFEKKRKRFFNCSVAYNFRKKIIRNSFEKFKSMAFVSLKIKEDKRERERKISPTRKMAKEEEEKKNRILLTFRRNYFSFEDASQQTHHPRGILYFQNKSFSL